MSQSLMLKIKGLFTSYNELSEAPEGALLVADDIELLKDSIAEPRRGFTRVDGAFSNASHRADKTWFYQDKQFAHHGAPGSANTVSYLSSGTWTSVGTYSAPAGVKLKTLNANQNLYFSTSTGIQKLDAFDGTAALAGAYKALDVSLSTSSSGSTWLTAGYTTAYRVIWGYKDANENLILGAPSSRAEYTASGANRAIDLRATIPSGVTTTWFVQVYRSKSVFETSPSDEMGLVYEVNPSAGDITNGYIDITDIVPDSLRGATIYTAASQEGLAAQNERPPLAKDMAVFRDSVFYANTTSKHRYTLTLLSASAMANDDTVTIDGVTYTAKASETVASAEFALATAGTPSQNITDTAHSLIRVINRYASSTVYAYYLSGIDDLPGKILLEERGIGGSSFALTSDNATCWSPELPSSGTTESSDDDRYKNGLFWSKPNQSESVPLTNFGGVGDKDDEILRVIPLRDALYIFKEKTGIYRLTGYYPNFTIELLDSSAKLVGSETPAILNNQIYCLTDQGVTAVSDTTKVISRPIEQTLLEIFGADLDLVKDVSFGVSYETDRKYYLFMPGSEADTTPTQAFVFNSFTNSWVRHVLDKTCGTVYNNKLYLGDATTAYIHKERKTYTYTDYVDYGFSTTITDVSDNVITVDSGADNIAIGDIMYQSASVSSEVTAVDSVTGQVTLSIAPGFTTDPVDVLKAIPCKIQWVPVTSGNPGITQQYHTVIGLFKSDFRGTADLKFTSDLSRFEETVVITGAAGGLWGQFGWGQIAWGGARLKRPVRQWIPRDKQRCSQLTIGFEHAVGYSQWELQGITVFSSEGSDRVAR